MIADYMKAMKIGEKEYRSCIVRGEYPYLPVLDELVSHVDIDAQVPLGLVQIPLDQVVGTYAAGRTTSFARNFMPILDENSEFAFKWSQLYDDMEAEGMRDPVIAYEFNNKFYVMEGNKRVSVSKYMGAVTIEGNVTRMMPKRTDDPECRLYYEFVDFYDITGVNYLYMSREGNFKKLISETYPVTDEEGNTRKWTKDEELEFRAFYTFFAKEFKARAEGKFHITVGDALCLFLGIFNYDEVKDASQSEIKTDVLRFWREFALYDKGDELTLVLNPTREPKKLNLMKLFPGNTQQLKIAFIHDKSANESSWTYSHELGRKYVMDAFGDKIATSCIERVDGDDADDVFDAAVEAGNKVIFATSPKLASPALRAAIRHPEVKILNCSMSLSHQTIRSYYLRMYEAKFITGTIAGVMLEHGSIGYISDYPIHGTTAEINAFALGVQTVNPRAKVFLEWSMVKDRDVNEEFRKNDVTLISGRDLNAKVSQGQEFGLYIPNEDGSHTNLAVPVRHWGKLYEEIIHSILSGGYKNDENVYENQALNYFWGMSSGAIDVIYSRNLPAGVVRMLRTFRADIRDMDLNPFTGPIFDQNGVMRCEDGQSLSAKESVSVDWLNDNIVGYIPDISELKDEAVDLVKVQGIKKETEGQA
ncbi:MAG: BMP family ABC transporter substrate-binding protein [Lachnospiraceae bacterium]|nr:BMP family ABC transporter substrate-binding protein [Lachnospiraceae bacterium]